MRLKKRYQNGGKPTGGGTASRQDSLNAYNAAVELLQALEDHGYIIEDEPLQNEYGGGYTISVGPTNQEFLRYMKGEFTPEERESYELFGNPPLNRRVVTVSEDGSMDSKSILEDDIYKYYGILDRSENDGVIRAREKTVKVINPSIPLGYYDRRIEPQGFMKAYGGQDIVELPYYDPVAVKPYDMLTEEEKAERLRKYGPEPKMRPVKQSQPEQQTSSMQSRTQSWPPEGIEPSVATRQDSLDAYNAAVGLQAELARQGYGEPRVIGEDVGVGMVSDHYRRLKGLYTDEEIKEYEQYKAEGQTIDDFYDVKEVTTSGNTTRAREAATAVINKTLPLGYYHSGIAPQGIIATQGPAPEPEIPYLSAAINWINSKTGYEKPVRKDDAVEFPYYDPIAVKPYDLLTEEEKAERLEKYGPEPWMRPVKQSQPEKQVSNVKVLKAPTTSAQPQPAQPPAQPPAQQRPAALGLRRMFPLSPPQNQIIATDERQLKEMLFDERKKGRETVRIMKADPQMRTGASPDYDVYWDEKRKSWRTRPIPQEEVDKYRKENRIFVTPRISF